MPEIQEAKDWFEKAKSGPKAQELIRIKEKAARGYRNDIAEAKNESEKIGIEKEKVKEVWGLKTNVDINIIAANLN